jgi:hypothetical protein
VNVLALARIALAGLGHPVRMRFPHVLGLALLFASSARSETFDVHVLNICDGSQCEDEDDILRVFEEVNLRWSGSGISFRPTVESIDNEEWFDIDRREDEAVNEFEELAQAHPERITSFSGWGTTASAGRLCRSARARDRRTRMRCSAGRATASGGGVIPASLMGHFATQLKSCSTAATRCCPRVARHPRIGLGVKTDAARTYEVWPRVCSIV